MAVQSDKAPRLASGRLASGKMSQRPPISHKGAPRPHFAQTTPLLFDAGRMDTLHPVPPLSATTARP